MSGKTIIDKIWDRHVVVTDEGGQSLLYIDWLICSEGSNHAFNVLRTEHRKVWRPRQVFGVPDHYTPSTGRTLADFTDEERKRMVTLLQQNVVEHDVRLFDLGDSRRGIQHLVGPEQGLTQPGVIILCGDSHTSTQGAMGALAFGIGGELSHALATQTIWQRKPKRMRIVVHGKRGRGVAAKDVILAIIAKIGAGGALQHFIEYAGPVIRDMSIEERMTVCNMSIEAGARGGMVAPDDKTIAYLRGRPFAPRAGEMWEAATAYWRELPSDLDAAWDREVTIDGSAIEPMVTWGNSPENGVGIGGVVPNPADEPDETRRSGMAHSLEYMDLKPGTPVEGLRIDRVFIGSCTNGRLEDIRAAAAIARGRKAAIPALVVPGSTAVKLAAEAEGLDRILVEAGFSWGEAGCSMCVSMNGDTVLPGERCASTSNRNFRGRQGRGSRTHLVSPQMAAAAAITGQLTDVRELMV